MTGIVTRRVVLLVLAGGVACWGLLTFLESQDDQRSLLSDTTSACGSSVETAVAFIEKEVGYFTFSDSSQSQRARRAWYIALSTMNYVQSRLSPLVWGNIYKTTGRRLNGVEECFCAEAGICGNHVKAFLRIVERFELKARYLQLYNIDSQGNNHAAVEVWFNDKWNYMDVTWGTFFRRPRAQSYELLSFDELRHHPDASDLAVTNASNMQYQHYEAAGLEPLAYLRSTTVDRVAGGRGTIRLHPRRDGAILRYSLANVPNHVGVNTTGQPGNKGDMKYQLEGVDPAHRLLQLQIQKIVCETGALTLRAGEESTSYDMAALGRGLFNATIPPLARAGEPVLFEVAPKDDSQECYLVLSSISLAGLDP